LNDYININTYTYIDNLQFRRDGNIKIIDILKQMLLYQNFSILPTIGNNYDTCRPSTYLNKFITNNINNVE